MNTTAIDTTQAVAKLTALGRQVMEVIGTRSVGFFDNGLEAGSGSWGHCLAPEAGVKPGVLTGLVKQGLFTVNTDDDGSWYDLTELGAAVARTFAPVEAPKPAKKAAKKAKAIPAQNSDKPLTNFQCCSRLAQLGYTGPTSYVMPVLRELVARIEAEHAAKA